jgi:hypothetical protein
LDGAWRGSGGNQDFFEGYRVVDDTTITISYYVDSTLHEVRDSGSVYLRGDRVYHATGGGLWIATRLDSVSVDFAPHENSNNAFTWTRQTPNSWVAVLRFADGREVAYRLERIDQ